MLSVLQEVDSKTKSSSNSNLVIHYWIFNSCAGLFSAAISMSGSMFTLWGHHPTGKPVARRLAANLGCSDDNSRQMIDCLRTRGAKEIVLATQDFFVSVSKIVRFWKLFSTHVFILLWYVIVPGNAVWNAICSGRWRQGNWPCPARTST